MQITIDSAEPLAKVAAVVGALYGVELVVAGSSPAPAVGAGRRAARSRRGAKVDPKIVRQWAVEQGFAVSTRGQLPKAVLTAYADSH
jgi:hypothetical protein